MPRQCRLKPNRVSNGSKKTGGFPPVSSLCPALRGGRVRIDLRGGARGRAGVPPVRQNISRRIKTAI
ncbi:hypothetical protein COI31_04940 [Neisseria meningitidis]|uniref:Uncharacterized protein n=1 Tax=Neisseria meningitidis alpha275 TaxID=295996 RepID=C6SMX9_NEIME|nr:hypothetical protein [Neisseria meningitidis]RNJ94078.1 hypothetical protein COI31_04940 [Neisseria meningitidis]RQJ69838.1 hypothetical protein COI08_11835 [Neisseria meningitidis]RQJ81901.1 hypothetical protein COI05_12030 [Neisseria meningitidis]CBA09865.1 hypothetical protein predicted by Glimmer/Critica [Neisseria meningitidis alpha275]